MKNVSFVVALAAIMAFTSCSKNDSADEYKTGNGAETYIGVSIALPFFSGTRAEDGTAGIAAEKLISTIAIFIVEGINADYEILDVNATNFAHTTVDNREIYTGKVAIPTTTGIKKVYAVANLTSDIISKLTVSGYTAMNAAAFGLTDDKFLTIASPTVLTSMVMSGAYTANGGLLDLSVAQTAEEAIASPIEITINRNLSKAVVQQASTYHVTGGTTTLSWTLINKANDANFLLQGTGTHYSIVPAGATNNDAHAYWSNFSGMIGTPDYINVLSYGTGDAKTAAYAESKYMFENYPTDFYAGNTTAARIKGVFVPTTVFENLSAGTPVAAEAFASGNDFYRSNIDGTYWTLMGRDAAILHNYNGHTATTDFIHYAGGVGYYTIWVNDGTNNGVDRNSYYLMQITEVRGPGSPTEPINPIVQVEEDTYIGVSIIVLNWDFKKSEQIIQ